MHNSLLKPLKGITTAFFLVSLIGCDAFFKNSSNSDYAIKRINDGDTMTVTDESGTEVKVRFACVDAPEVAHTTTEKNTRNAADKNQFKWGEISKQRLQQLVKQGGNRVKLTITDTDQYGRKVSEVRLPNGVFVQQVLIQEGLVQVYKPYLKNCPSSDIVQQAEADAKKRRVGVWRDSKYISAWEWRGNNKQ